MSLKSFHVFFIIIATLFLLAFGAWGVREYRATHANAALAMSIIAFVGGIMLLVYGRWFLRKLKDVSYI